MRDILNSRSHRSAGMTLVEVIVAVTVMGILSGFVLGSLGDYYIDNVSSAAKSTQDTNTHDVLRALESDLSNAASWTTALTVGVPLGPTNSTVSPETWSYCGTGGILNCTQTTNRVLIVYRTATDKAPSDPTRLPLFAQTGGICDNSLSIDTVKVAQIYFVAADRTDASKMDLYRRTVVNPSGAVICNSLTPYQKNTCAASVASQPACKDSSGVSHLDAVLLTGVQSFDVDYFTAASDINPIASPYIADPNDIASTQAVRIKVATNQLIGGKPSTLNSDLIISRQY